LAQYYGVRIGDVKVKNYFANQINPTTPLPMTLVIVKIATRDEINV
jgi:hypothetical protein